jgi:hypothetical protein
MADKGEGPAIGIDLGTTYSCVAVWQYDRVEVIVNDQGNRTTPSYVAFTDKERLVGDAAKNQVARNPTNSIFGIFFLTCLRKGRGGKIRTCDLRFIRRDSQLIKLSLGGQSLVILVSTHLHLLFLRPYL